MPQINKILLSTDFSPGAAAATALALEMARRFSAKLTILHVYWAPVYIGAMGDSYAPPPEMIERLRADAEQALADERKRAQAAGVDAEILAAEGIPADVIVAAARKGEIDLIVMGTEGRTGLKHLLLGSVAERVVRTAACPVLTARVVSKPEAAAS